MKQIPPKKFNLHRSVKLFRKSQRTIVIEKHRKSRIIMKDGKKIFEIAKQIRKTEPSAHIVLETSAPICGKTKVYLSENNITVNEHK